MHTDKHYKLTATTVHHRHKRQQLEQLSFLARILFTLCKRDFLKKKNSLHLKYARRTELQTTRRSKVSDLSDLDLRRPRCDVTSSLLLHLTLPRHSISIHNVSNMNSPHHWAQYAQLTHNFPSTTVRMGLQLSRNGIQNKIKTNIIGVFNMKGIHLMFVPTERKA
jgi:hypothetical protein